MTDDTNEHVETEARLRAALSARADSVDPAPADVSAAIAAGAAARRRRTFLTAAAVVAVIAAVAGAVLLLGGDDEDEVASGPETTTTTTAPLEGSGAPVIWPLPSMSIQYETPEDAVLSFVEMYLGIGAGCVEPTDADDTFAVPSVCGAGAEPAGQTSVTVEPRGLGWVVLSAESMGFDVINPAAGAVVGANIDVDTGVLIPPGVSSSILHTAELRPLGEPAGSAPTVDTNTVPLGADGSWHLILGAADGPVVLIVTDGNSATARVITVDSVAVPTETTTTTTGPTDDGVVGWPGGTSRVFEDPLAAATSFVTEVLGFAQPTEIGAAIGTPDELNVTFSFAARPTASITTQITVHDTGTARGWVVTGVSSAEGTIDEVTRNGDEITLAGSASAFEASVNVRLYDLEGNVLGEAQTMAGANGEQGPYAVTVTRTVTTSEPAYVQIADDDESGEGAYIWATWAAVPAA